MTLTIEADGGLWYAFGMLDTDTDNDGISSIVLDVRGIGGVDVTGSQRELPRFYDTSFNQTGFVHTFSSDGVEGIGIAQLQITVNTPPVGVRILTGIGSVGGSEMAPFAPPGFPPAGMQTWGTPVLLASGTYDDSGAGGGAGLRVDLAPTTQVNVLIEGYVQGQPQGVREVDGVVSGLVLLGGNTNPDANAGGARHWEHWAGGKITLDGSGSHDNDPGDAIVSWEWSISNGGDFAPLADGETALVTYQDIADALYGGDLEALPGAADLDLKLIVKDTNDATGEDLTTLFIPEPGTMALVAIGSGLALVRRRRRA